MIRETTNSTISTAVKEVSDPTANPGIGSESIEHVDSTAGLAEKKDIEARVAGQTTTPSNAFNGSFE